MRSTHKTINENYEDQDYQRYYKLYSDIEVEEQQTEFDDLTNEFEDDE